MPVASTTPSWVTTKRTPSFTPPCTLPSLPGSSIPDQTTKKTKKITDFFCTVKGENTKRDNVNTNRFEEKKKSKTLPKQLFLDLGQPLAEICKVCGMRYSQSFDVDIKLHTRFHKFYLKGITFPIKRYSKGCEVMGEMSKGYKIYRVWNSDKSSLTFLLRNVEQVVDLVNKEMEAACQSREELAKLQIFVCLKGDNQVIGLLLIQQISKAYVAIMSDDSGSISIVPNSERSACLGVSRMWVRKEYRRQGIAAKMLSLAGKHQAHPIKKEQIAFSQPTMEGFKFACKYQHGAMNLSNDCCLVFV